MRKQKPAFQIGLAALDRGGAASAVELFRQSTTIDGRHHQSWRNPGMSLLAARRCDESEAVL